MNKKLISIAVFIMAVWFYTSCKKTDVPNTPVTPNDTTAILGFKDSTQLIKSITIYNLDSGSNTITDSSTLKFHYDTVSRSISIVPVTSVAVQAGRIMIV